MKKLKKLLAIFLATVMLFCLTTTVVSADIGDHQMSEAEPNNTTSTADRIYDDYTVSGYLASGIDIDYFKFTLNQRSKVTIIAVVDYSSFMMGVWDSSDECIGASQARYNDGSYSASLVGTLSSGTYYLGLLDEYQRYNFYVFYITIEPVVTTHTHSYTTLKHDSTYHWYECSCGAVSGKTTHNFNDLSYNSTHHWYECFCGATDTKAEHYGGTATYTDRAICDYCNQPYGTVLKYYQDAPTDAPVLVSKDYDTVTLEYHSGYEYRRSGGAWQSSNVFTGLNGDTSYTFTQRKAETDNYYTSSASPSLTVKTSIKFSDVSKHGWYYKGVQFVTDNGYFNGYGGTNKFGTADNIQRQDFVVALARLDGVNLDTYSGITNFADVPQGSYYAKAVQWASENGIVTGYTHNNKFGVGDNITREQLVVILYRYVKNYKGQDTSIGNASATRYPDFKSVSDWAQEAIVWAIDNNVISGKEGTYIAPLQSAQRCEVAQIIYNSFNNGILHD